VIPNTLSVVPNGGNKHRYAHGYQPEAQSQGTYESSCSTNLAAFQPHGGITRRAVAAACDQEPLLLQTEDVVVRRLRLMHGLIGLTHVESVALRRHLAAGHPLASQCHRGEKSTKPSTRRPSGLQAPLAHNILFGLLELSSSRKPDCLVLTGNKFSTEPSQVSQAQTQHQPETVEQHIT
jgi:hypothetical protein